MSNHLANKKTRITEHQKSILNTILIILMTATFVLLGVKIVSGKYWFESYNLSEKGGLGDAVNGLSAPFISFFSSILIYITFKEQNKANKLLQTQWQLDTFLKIFNEMIEKTDKLYIKSIHTDSNDSIIIREYRGIDICYHIKIEPLGNTIPKDLGDLIYIIDDLIILCEIANESPQNKKIFMSQKIFRFYHSGLHNGIGHLYNKLSTNYLICAPFKNAVVTLEEKLNRLRELNKELEIMFLYIERGGGDGYT